MSVIGNFIGGERVASTSGRTGPVYNPATGAQIATVALSSEDETRAAIANAEAAFKIWSKVTPLNRARVMFKYKELIEKHADEIATLISQEHGKVFSDAKGELTRGLEVVEFACGIPHLQKGEHSLNVGRGVDSYSQMMPMGVCAGISPFNFPAMVPMWMFPVAIACGNTFIMKPSEKDPSTPLRLAELLKEAGLPDGVLAKGDDGGGVSLAHFPWTSQEAGVVRGHGHGTHVSKVRFTADDNRLITMGGFNRSVLQYRVVPTGADENGISGEPMPAAEEEKKSS